MKYYIFKINGGLYSGPFATFDEAEAERLALSNPQKFYVREY